jgi:hypothetical protein
MCSPGLPQGVPQQAHRSLVAPYGNIRPLWLFVEVADSTMQAPRALEEIACSPLPPISPYEQVIVIRESMAIAIKDGISRMDVATTLRKEPFWPGY